MSLYDLTDSLALAHEHSGARRARGGGRSGGLRSRGWTGAEDVKDGERLSDALVVTCEASHIKRLKRERNEASEAGL